MQRKLELAIVVFLFAFSIFVSTQNKIPVAFAQTIQNSPWPEFQQNSFHTGISQLKGPSTNATKWKSSTGGYVEGTPALSPDNLTVYYGTSAGYLYAADAATGTTKWDIQAGGYSFDSSPAVSPNGTIYFSSDGHSLYAVNPNGSISWQYSLGSSRVASSPMVGPNGAIYFGSDNGVFYALSPSGSLDWEFTASSSVFSTPVLNSLGNSIVFGDSSGMLYSLSTSGAEQWNFSTSEGPILYSSTFSPNGTSVYFDVLNYTTQMNYLYSLSSSNGSPQWTFPNNASEESTPAVDSNGTIYFSHLIAVNPDGSLRWIIDSDSPGLRASPIVQDNIIYYDDNLNDLNAIYQNESSLWTISGYAVSFSTPLVSNGTVYAGNDDSNLYSVSENGTQNWSIFTGNPLSSSIIVGSDGTIYAGSYGDTVYAFSATGSGMEWDANTTNKNPTSPAIVSNDQIFQGSYDTSLYIFYSNATETPNSETFYANDSITTSLALGPDGTVYMGDESGIIYSVGQDGNTNWQYTTMGAVYSTPALSRDGKTVYAGSDDGRLYAILTSNGQLAWSFDTNAKIIGSPTVASTGVIYFGSLNGDFYALTPSGSQQWVFNSGGPIVSSPALSPNEETVYFGSNSGKLIALNATTGTLEWSFSSPGGYVDSAPSVGSDGTIYFGSTNGVVYALSPTGSLIWSFATGAYIQPAMWNYAFNTGSVERISSPTPILATGNTLYFSTSDGYLYAIGPNTTSTTSLTVSGSTITNPYYCCTASTTAFATSPATTILGLSMIEFSVIIGAVVVVAAVAAVFVIRSRRPRYRRAR